MTGSKSSTLYEDLKALKAQVEALRNRHAIEIADTVHVLRGSGCTVPVPLDRELKDLSLRVDDCIDTYEGANKVGIYTDLSFAEKVTA